VGLPQPAPDDRKQHDIASTCIAVSKHFRANGILYLRHNVMTHVLLLNQMGIQCIDQNFLVGASGHEPDIAVQRLWRLHLFTRLFCILYYSCLPVMGGTGNASEVLFTSLLSWAELHYFLSLIS
jgi:hypothetical protein